MRTRYLFLRYSPDIHGYWNERGMEAEYDDSIEDKESVKQRLLQSWILFG